jgi:hypothetical protein
MEPARAHFYVSWLVTALPSAHGRDGGKIEKEKAAFRKVNVNRIPSTEKNRHQKHIVMLPLLGRAFLPSP